MRGIQEEEINYLNANLSSLRNQIDQLRKEKNNTAELWKVLRFMCVTNPSEINTTNCGHGPNL